MIKVTSFGEVLWDDLPNGKVLGGAPLNVMVRLSALGVDCSVISRCGNDVDGATLLKQVAEKKVRTDLIQIDNYYATSLVKVNLDNNSSPSYDIVYPCAWDKIEVNETAVARVAESDAFVYGSLCTRDEVSRKALEQFLVHAKLKIFDVNLRKPHYDIARLVEMMKQADLIKLNDQELYEISHQLGSPYHSLEQNIHFLACLTRVEDICVTLGEHGAVYYCKGKLFSHHGFKVDVVDTVGAGDSFLAGFIYQLLNQAPAEKILSFACALGALVAGTQGATVDISMQKIQKFMQPNL